MEALELAKEGSVKLKKAFGVKYTSLSINWQLPAELKISSNGSNALVEESAALLEKFGFKLTRKTGYFFISIQNVGNQKLMKTLVESEFTLEDLSNKKESVLVQEKEEIKLFRWVIQSNYGANSHMMIGPKNYILKVVSANMATKNFIERIGIKHTVESDSIFIDTGYNDNKKILKGFLAVEYSDATWSVFKDWYALNFFNGKVKGYCEPRPDEGKLSIALAKLDIHFAGGERIDSLTVALEKLGIVYFFNQYRDKILVPIIERNTKAISKINAIITNTESTGANVSVKLDVKKLQREIEDFFRFPVFQTLSVKQQVKSFFKDFLGIPGFSTKGLGCGCTISERDGKIRVVLRRWENLTKIEQERISFAKMKKLFPESWGCVYNDELSTFLFQPISEELKIEGTETTVTTTTTNSQVVTSVKTEEKVVVDSPYPAPVLSLGTKIGDILNFILKDDIKYAKALLHDHLRNDREYAKVVLLDIFKENMQALLVPLFLQDEQLSRVLAVNILERYTDLKAELLPVPEVIEKVVQPQSIEEFLKMFDIEDILNELPVEGIQLYLDNK